MAVTQPTRVPEPGYYYHYKHDPSGAINNYAYEVVGVGFHTEHDEHFVVYRPIYEASVYEMGQKVGIDCLDVRPLEMWMGEVEVGGVTRKRFEKIDDPATIRALEETKNRLYQTKNHL